MKQGYLKLGDVCGVQNGFAFDSKFFSTNKESGRPLIRIRDILKGHSCTYYTSSYQEEYIVHKGDFLIGMDGDFNIGQWQSEDALLNQRVCRLLPSDEIIPKFIFYFIPTALQKINAETSYATVKHLSSKQIKEILIPKLSLSEQQRIVALLDAEFTNIDALKANAEKNLQNAKDLFQAALKKELEPKEGWKKSIVGNVCSIISGYAFDSQGYSSNENDTLLICGDNIVHCAFRWETIKRWNKDKYENLRRFAIQENDIVLAMDRPWVKSGLKIAKVSKRELPSLLIQRTACIRAKEGIESEFIYFALQNDAFSKYLIEQQTGVGVPHISGKQIMNYEISLPSLPIQQSIVARLDVLNEKCKTLQANYEKTLTLCDDLKQALLRKAFNGEI